MSLEPWYPRFCDDNCLSTVSAVLGAFDLPATIHIVLRNVFETRQIHQSGSKLNPFWHIPTTVRLGAFTPETLPALLYGGTLGTCVGEGGSPLRTTNSIVSSDATLYISITTCRISTAIGWNLSRPGPPKIRFHLEQTRAGGVGFPPPLPPAQISFAP